MVGGGSRGGGDVVVVGTGVQSSRFWDWVAALPKVCQIGEAHETCTLNLGFEPGHSLDTHLTWILNLDIDPEHSPEHQPCHQTYTLSLGTNKLILVHKTKVIFDMHT